MLYAAGHRPLAPDFTATTLTGSQLSFSSYRGKVVVLNFWGSWCVPCREEAPTLSVVAAQYQPSGVSFLGVDVRDTTASAEAFARSFHITYPSVSDPSSVITLDFTAVVPIAGTPTTLVIDRTGHIAGAVFGTVTYPELTAILAKVTGKAAGGADDRCACAGGGPVRPGGRAGRPSRGLARHRLPAARSGPATG